MPSASEDSKYQSISDSIYNSLSDHFRDYHWEVHFILGPSIDSCDVLQANCITIPFSAAFSSLPASKVVAVWSPKRDMSPHVGKAKDALDTMVTFSDHLYGAAAIREALAATEDMRSAMLAFMIDPSTYIKNENLTVIDNSFNKAMSRVNFYSNNVLTVLPKNAKFFSKSDDTSYRSGAGRLLTKRSMLSEKMSQLSDHSVIVSYYSRYDKPQSSQSQCA